jgi:FkbM family methyltransferase
MNYTFFRKLRLSLKEILPEKAYDIFMIFWTFFSDKYARFVMKNSSFKSPKFEILLVDGHEFSIKIDPTNGLIDHVINGGNIYEENDIKFVRKICQDLPGYYLDIGANIGLFSILLSDIAAKNNAKIIAFEPIKKIYNQFLESVQANKIGDVVDIRNYGLSDSDQEVSIWTDSENMGGSTINPTDEYKLKTVPEKIIIKKGDSVLSEISNQISFIKIDVEGHELHVFLGLEGTISNSRPKIFFEYSPYIIHSLGQNPVDILNLLKRHKYTLFDVENNEIILDIQEFTNRLIKTKIQTNIFAREELLSEIVSGEQV